MAVGSEIAAAAKAGADSVFGYVERTAEVVPDGVRWQTLTYENEPQYASGAGSGVAGVVLFLADYFRMTGTARARELAFAGARWCSSPGRADAGDSLTQGRAGLGMAWLRLAAATGDGAALAQAAALAEPLLGREPGPVTTMYTGAAGEGTFLLRLAEHTRDARHLDGAVRRGAWLEDVAVRYEHGCYWPYQVDDEPWYGLGFGPGVAGIGYFLAVLFGATRDQRWADLVGAAAGTLAAQAKPDRGGLNWAQTLDEGDLLRCQLCDGSPGVGMFYARAHELIGEGAFLEQAKAAAEATWAYGDVRSNPCQCHGLAGNAEVFLELYRLTREPVWLERAHDFAVRAQGYRTSTPDGDVWQADDPGYTSPEFLVGGAGTGHFFLRLWKLDELRLPLF